MQFMVDCVVRFDRRMEQGIPVRRLEISKYRGSAFAPGEFPLSFGPHGMEVASPGATDIPQEVSTERASTGFAGLDQMLGGGLFRGSSTLITGAPGTSKTTLAGLFAESACRRGERTLFVSFDEGGERVRRNLKSVGIDLDAHVKSGLLQMYSGRTDTVNPEEHLLRIAAQMAEHRPRCMVIDPLSAISRTGALSSARAIGNRLIYKLRDRHITAVITALVEGDDPKAEATELQISTIADNWIQLSYLVRGGERNRALTIVKSRGTRHSNQVRELILSDTGLALADVYSSGGEVLMGTLRWEKEVEEKSRGLLRETESAHKRRELQFAEADTAARITALQLDLERHRAALALYSRDDAARHVSSGEQQTEVRRLRGGNGADTATTPKRQRRTSRRTPAGTATDRSEHVVASKKMKKGAVKEAVTTVVVMRLYIAGRAPNSVKAIANLEAICRQHLKDSYKLEIVDVCEHPRRALDDGILVTPSLAKVSPSPGANVIGNLSDTSSVLAALGLKLAPAT